MQCLDEEGALHERQAGFRINRSCMDNVYTYEIVKGRLREDKKASFYIYKKLMILCDMLVCGINCRTWV